MYRGKPHKELANSGIFFYDMSYMEPKMSSAFGQVTPLPLPSFGSKDWSLPTSQTSESFRSRLFQDIQKSLKYTIATKTVRLTLFIPVEVFVDFFYDEQIRSTTTMFICKSESCLDFLDDNWDRKQSQSTLCLVQKKSIICKYIIGSQNFIVSFYYFRFHLLNGQLIPLDQDITTNPENKPLAVEIYFQENLITVIDIMSSTSLAQLRTELTLEELPLMPESYAFSLNNRKVLTKWKNFLCIDMV